MYTDGSWYAGAKTESFCMRWDQVPGIKDRTKYDFEFKSLSEFVAPPDAFTRDLTVQGSFCRNPTSCDAHFQAAYNWKCPDKKGIWCWHRNTKKPTLCTPPQLCGK